jgi:hypothetical protein
MNDQYVVGISSWIIQDGNYSDFTQGMNTAFALEFREASQPEELVPDSSIRPSLTLLDDDSYASIARVIHVAEDWWAIDAGILAFKEGPPPGYARLGAWLRGKIYLEVDPYFYFFDLGHRLDAPALVYEWKIEKISLQTAPFIEFKPRHFKRDPAKLGWREIPKTDVWEDDDCSAEYLFQCTCLGGPRPPKNKSEP